MRVGIAFAVKGLPRTHPGPLPWWVREPSLAATLRNCCKTRWHGHCLAGGEVPPGQTLWLLPETLPQVACVRAERRVWGLASPVGKAWRPKSSALLLTTAAPMYPQPPCLSNARHLRLEAFPKSCILFMLSEMSLRHILLFSLRRT